MPVKLTYTQDTESGNVAALLSSLSGVDVLEIEKLLSGGILPREAAKKLGVDDEFCEIVTHRVNSQLCEAVKKSLISKNNADKIADSFMEGFLS